MYVIDVVGYRLDGSFGMGTSAPIVVVSPTPPELAALPTVSVTTRAIASRAAIAGYLSSSVLCVNWTPSQAALGNVTGMAMSWQLGSLPGADDLVPRTPGESIVVWITVMRNPRCRSRLAAWVCGAVTPLYGCQLSAS